MLAQVRQFEIQTVMAARAEPVRQIITAGLLLPQVELDRQLKVVHAFFITQQHIQFTQGVTLLANGQVGRQHLDTRRGMQGELPEAFVVQPQTAHRALAQPLLQGLAVGIQAQ